LSESDDTISHPPALALISYQHIMAETLPPVDWLVEPLIAHGDRVVVYGQFGSLKSWLLLHLGLAVAAGQPWLSTFPIPAPHVVVYVDEEMSVRTLRRRVKRLGLGSGLEASPLEFHVLSHPRITFDAHGADALLAGLAMQALQPSVIIIETFRRVLQGSENAAEDVSAFWRNIEPLRAAGTTLILSHHMRKPHREGDQDSRYHASGSTDILAGADTAFAVKLAAKGLIGLTCVKARNAEEPKPFYVSLHDTTPESPIAMRFEGYQHPTSHGPAELMRASELIRTIMARAVDRTMTVSDLLTQVQAGGVTERTAQRAWRLAKELGQVAAVKHGVWQWKPPALAA